MKRSRRSLGVLLGAMSLALVVVRATTLPARPLATAARCEARSEAGHRTAQLPDFVRKPRQCRLSLRERAPVRGAKGDDRPPRRAVSATAVIVVLPRVTVVPPQFRTGWSGCRAYANGCDHLGRSLPPTVRGRRSPVDRLLLACVQCALTPLDRLSRKSASLLIEMAAPLDRRQTLASDWPDLLRNP